MGTGVTGAEMLAEGLKVFFRSGHADQDAPLVVTFPDMSFEAGIHKRAWFRPLTSAHTRDLRYLALLMMALVMAALFLIAPLANGNTLNLNVLIPGFLAAVFTLITFIYQIGKRRLATVDLYAMEMLTVIRLFVITRFVHSLKRLYECDKKEAVAIGARRFRADASAAFLEHAAATSFRDNVENLGSLSPDIIDYATAFYTFLGAVKEHTAAFLKYLDDAHADGVAPDAEVTDKYVGLILYLVDITVLVALRCLDRLIHTDALNRFARQLCLVVAADSNNFLSEAEHYKTDPKQDLIRNRRKFFRREIDRVERDIQRAGRSLRPGERF
ncbi:MAG: hypothetical protein RIC52_18570 [Amphiplicatus sp.]